MAVASTMTYKIDFIWRHVKNFYSGFEYKPMRNAFFFKIENEKCESILGPLLFIYFCCRFAANFFPDNKNWVVA